ncbi:MAG: hypothetical protein C0404_01470 [Verrucomicrobia bacterium]|nr:hypothetical protein [Verrucomicrobiota bacterium]
MSKNSDSHKDDDLLLTLQEGIPFVSRPMQAIGERFQMSEDDVVARIQHFFKTGKARRFGAIFDSSRLGYKSALCSVLAEPARLDSLADALKPYQSITHCYARELMPGMASPGEIVPNLWFTVTARADLFDKEIGLITGSVAPLEVAVLPAVRRFKIQVILDPRLISAADHGSLHLSHQQNAPGKPVASFAISAKEQEVVRLLQGNLSLTTDPVKEIAKRTGSDPQEIVDLLLRWHEAGVLRRIALILNHQKIGFRANAMCVWNVVESKVEQAGRCLAEVADVTHCYERICTRVFPYNLYAMVHAGDAETIRSLFKELSLKAGLSGGRIMVSAREYKKTSPRFFCEKE